MSEVSDAVRMLTGVEGFELPSWEALLEGARPGGSRARGTRGGWQHEAASRVERNFRDRRLMPLMSRSDQALLRSQSGPFAGMALSAAPTNALSKISPQLFRVLLLRRLRLPLPLCSRACRRGRLLLAIIADGDPLSRVLQPECAAKRALV